jgi:hypothetical protein
MATTEAFQEGNLLTFTCNFTDEVTGDPLNPTAVGFGYRVNGGAVTSYIFGSGNEITNPVEGTFQIEESCLGLAGTWVWAWQSSGVGEAYDSGSITVTQKPMAVL